MVIPVSITLAPTPAVAVTDEDPSFVLNQNDLEFILRQIQISEAHAADQQNPSNYTLLCGNPQDATGTCVPDVMRPAGVRTVDGSYNNLFVGRSAWGSGLQEFPRMLDPVWREGEPAPSQEAPPNFGGTPPGSAPGPHAICQAPGTPGAGMDPWGDTCYAQTEGFVYDSEPRVVSNLIVDQTTSNPAIVNQIDAGTAELIPGTDMARTPNTAPDEGLSAPFNTFLGFFGQFFDHGLDQISKGGHGTLVVPLEADDPLYDPESNTNFLVLTRADRIEDAEGNATTEFQNRTSPFVDQNQTYSSHPAHQVFLREFNADATETGHLLEGAAGGMATWADVKRQANEIFGIALDDGDLLAVPQLLVDPYGNFIPGPVRGLPQLIVADGTTVDDVTFVEGNLESPVSTANALSTGHAFLDDIAHGATPLFDADGNLVPLQFDENGDIIDPEIPLFDASGAPVSDTLLTGYDNVALNDHFIAGDGRVNENIGLTAVHAVFHAEHNRMVGQIERLLSGDPSTALLRNDQTMADPTLLAEFAAAFRGEEHSYPSAKAEETLPGPQADDWSYEQRLFQAAKFATEMQYQHIVFEEFARTIAPTIDAVVFNENSYNAGMDPSITMEFAQVVYRFGHSMMTEEIGREDVPGATGLQDVPLLDGFLNPAAFDLGGTLTPGQAAGSIINGTTNRIGSQIDEHVTDTLRNNLLGLPLDLATINLLRGRDVGIPPLQAARETFFAETGDAALEPYSDWVDFGLNLRNGNNFGRGGSNASLVNFVAAYGTHPTVTAATTLDERREAAQILVNGAPAGLEFITRFPGTDRYHTAALFSQRHYLPNQGVVYLANATRFPDALSAGALGAPVLLVNNDRTGGIPKETHAELLRLNAQRIVVLGDQASVSDETIISLNALSATDAPVSRLAGPNRYFTSAAIAENFAEPVERVFVASGQVFPDALAGAAVAAQSGSPVLIVQQNAIPDVIAEQLDRLNPAEIVVLGGTPSVSASVQTQLAQYTTGTVVRVAGGNRYETAIEISKRYFPDGADRLYVTIGTRFPDALAAAPGAGINGSPILLLPPTGLTPALRAEIERLSPTEIHVLGNTFAVNTETETQLMEFAPAPLEAPADRLDFINGTGAWADVDGTTVTGLEDVEFWVGGLAERIDAFGGMLGSTFNFVFEQQLEALQFGDRFYYLFRNQGEQLFAALEANSFSDLIQRNTDASHLPANIFALQDPIIDLEALPSPVPAGLLGNAIDGWRWTGDEHVELHGTAGADRMTGDEGDDALWGYDGDDRIEGGSGNDSILGGHGDDIITDSFGDDTIHGDQGNDAIHIGPGAADLGLGGLGDDFIVNGGGDASQFFLGMGDDVVLGTSGRMTVFGGEQHDWVEGGSHADLLQGDNADQFQNDTLGGNDVVIGGLGNDDIEGEGGDDILIGSAVGTDRHLGNIGFDWLTYYGQTADVTSDWQFSRVFEPNNPLPSRFDLLEALSGGAGSDTLRGPLVEADDVAASEIPLHRATQESLDLIDGLEALLRPTGAAYDYAAPLMRDTPPIDADGVSMIIIGGPGNDSIEGRGGNDYLDGDAMLRVQLEDTTTGERFDSAQGLQARVFAGTLNPGDIDIVREIVMDPDAATSSDTSVYNNPMSSYTVTPLPDGYWQIQHTLVDEAEESDGTDVIRGFERLQFSDGCAVLNDAGDTWEACEPVGTVTLSTDAPVEDVPITASLMELDGVTPLDVSEFTSIEFTWWAGEGDTPDTVSEWEELVTISATVTDGAATSTYAPPDAAVDQFLRVTASYIDTAGLRQTTGSAVTTGVVLNGNDVPTGLSIGYTGAPAAAPQVGQLLLAAPVADGDGVEDVVFTHLWERTLTPDDAASWAEIGGTTNAYTTVEADAGYYIRVTVSYTDNLGGVESPTYQIAQPVGGLTP
ncbi:peroxidase family protein [Agrococcus baldri]|nr:peroxidase family protein [Agrococcus baldri]